VPISISCPKYSGDERLTGWIIVADCEVTIATNRDCATNLGGRLPDFLSEVTPRFEIGVQRVRQTIETQLAEFGGLLCVPGITDDFGRFLCLAMEVKGAKALRNVLSVIGRRAQGANAVSRTD